MFPAQGFMSPGYYGQQSSGVRFQHFGNHLPDKNNVYRNSQLQVPPMGYQLPILRPERNMNATQFGVRMSSPVQQGDQVRSYAAGGGQKRRNDDNITHSVKRARADSFAAASSSSSAMPSPPMLPSKVKNFVVPVSSGTEKITMEIWNYFLSAKMEDEDFQKKLLLRKCLFQIISWAFPNCNLFIVGSSMTGFATKTSDVDMCLMISQDEVDQKRDAALILNSICKALMQCSTMRSRQVIKAKVPILKFFDSVAGVECDLNINNLVGVRNTHLLRCYAYMDWRVRPLMLFVKKWARFHDINDASKQTISSYSLTLMLIHYLQAGVTPAVLPCLQQMRPDLFDNRIDVRKLSLNFDKDLKFISRNQSTLGELFLGFLKYYANEFSFKTEVISVRLGKTLSFKDVSSRGSSMQWKHLNIEEPFEGSNTARSVYDQFVFTRVLRVFQTSYKTLEKSRDMEDLFKRPF